MIFTAEGQLLTGLADGRVVRIDPVSGAAVTVADTGGRPLGLHPRADGGVLVCDHDKGLLAVRTDGSVDVLFRTGFASNVVESPDGTIWFTTSTTRWDLDHYLGDIFEHTSTGRLLRRDPDGTVTTLMTDLKFGNGLVLTGSSLLIAETAGYRIRRLDVLTGRESMFASNLPGFPDNMSLGSDGLVWVAMAAPRDPLLDRLLPLPGFLRTAVWNLPASVRPEAKPVASVMAFDQDGRVVHDLRSSDAGYHFVTSVAEHDSMIALGSLAEHDVVIVSCTD